MSRFCAILMLFLSLAVLLAPQAANAAESYGNCTNFISSLPATISTSGTWCLNQNLSTAITSGEAITIFADNVTLDCNDFMLDGHTAGLATQAYGIGGSNFLNTTVRHCSIRGFFGGLRLVGSNGGGHLIEDNRFDGNTFYGLLVEGDGSVVRRNRVFNTGGTAANTVASGIDTTYSVDVLDNTVAGVAATGGGGGDAIGIYVGSNASGSIRGNRIRGVQKDGGGSAFGIDLDISSDRVALRNNDLVGDASANSVGLSCVLAAPRAKDNVISGFATGISVCGNSGGNVIKP